jgi:protein-S-isoprenylcysteine O-methyltransferase Ste14
MKHASLIGAGDKLALVTLPVLAVGLALNILVPSVFSVGGPPPLLRTISIVLLVPGVALWLWAVALIILKAAKGQLITNGPYALVKHPIYTSVALLVLPWAGFLLNTWLGVPVGTALYVGSRLYAPEEEKLLAKTFGAAWDAYAKRVRVPWL